MTDQNIYRVYLRFNDTDVLIPQTPSKITISNTDRIEELTTADDRPFTLPKFDGPQFFEFDFECTKQLYPFTFESAHKNFKWYTDLIWKMKAYRGPLYLTILRGKDGLGEYITTNAKVVLRDYSYVEDAENANDVTISLKFSEYHGQNNYEIGNNKGNGKLIKANQQQIWKEKGLFEMHQVLDDNEHKQLFFDRLLFFDLDGENIWPSSV